MNIDKKGLLTSLSAGDMITYEDCECIIVDNSDESKCEYLIMDIETCKVLNAFNSLNRIGILPGVFLIAKNDKITLTFE